MLQLAAAIKIFWSIYGWFGWATSAMSSIIVTEEIKKRLTPIPENVSVTKRVAKILALSMSETTKGILKIALLAYLALQVSSLLYFIKTNDYTDRMVAAGKEVNWCNDRPKDLPPSPECNDIGQWSQRWLDHEWLYAVYFAFNSLQWCGTSACYDIATRVPSEVFVFFFKPAVWSIFGTIALLILLNYRQISKFQRDLLQTPANQRVDVVMRELLTLPPLGDGVLQLSTEKASAPARPLEPLPLQLSTWQQPHSPTAVTTTMTTTSKVN